MKRVLLLGSTLILAVTTLVAQSNTTLSAGPASGQTATNFVLALPAQGCPVSMHALQGSGTGLVAVRGEQHVSDVSQRIRLILTNPKSAQIARAKVRVFGLSSKNRLEQASVNQLDLTNHDDASDLARTLDVAFTAENDKDAAAELVLPGFTSVRSIQLESVTYKDGSTWSVAGPQSCRVAPDPMMLIAGR